MSDESSFTVSNFYKFVNEKRLMAVKCNNCGSTFLPPKPTCTNCLSTELKWIEVENSGKLLSYTIIHVAPEHFKSMAPYTIGIIEFKKGLRLPGMICGVSPENLKVGMPLKICFDTVTSNQWPKWSRYFFTTI